MLIRDGKCPYRPLLNYPDTHTCMAISSPLLHPIKTMPHLTLLIEKQRNKQFIFHTLFSQIISRKLTLKNIFHSFNNVDQTFLLWSIIAFKLLLVLGCHHFSIFVDKNAIILESLKRKICDWIEALNYAAATERNSLLMFFSRVLFFQKKPFQNLSFLSRSFSIFFFFFAKSFLWDSFCFFFPLSSYWCSNNNLCFLNVFFCLPSSN